MDLADKIRKIERLIASTQHEGEKRAAKFAKLRLQKSIEAELVEYTVSTESPWQKRLFSAICQKYGLRTYRYKRQKYTTAMVRISKSFMDSVLWPEYVKYSEMFHELANEIMENLTAKIHRVVDEDEVIQMGELPLFSQGQAR